MLLGMSGGWESWGAPHEVIHGRPTGVPVGEVKVAMALIAVSGDGTRWGGVSSEGKCPPNPCPGNQSVETNSGLTPARLGQLQQLRPPCLPFIPGRPRPRAGGQNLPRKQRKLF